MNGESGFTENGGVATKSKESSEPKFAYLDNKNINRLPNHLKQFIIDQNYKKYTPIDHAVWRYIMRQNFNFLKDHAHSSYVKGLNQTGISIEKIPSIEEMNDILAKIGWAAVPVDGFIPPAAFMEYQAYNVLVIAADMRQINHIEYTPAPDIVHEAAGHAPIIADPKYAQYLRLIGEVGSKAMSSRKDFELYEAIRRLSILMESETSTKEEIKKSEEEVEYKQKHLGKPSEMALLSRLHWYTVEYGLIGTLENPKLYGAGLLSSIGESSNFLKDSVKKIPYNLKTSEYLFDITTQQPQLFVTPDFDHLIKVLTEFADTMAYKTGGTSGLNKAIECRNTSTAVYSSGLQVSGVFEEIKADDNDRPVFIKLSSAVSLAVDNKELNGQGKDYHKDGFSSPVGNIKGSSTAIENMNDEDLSKLGIKLNEQSSFEFESGIRVNGQLDKIVRENGKLVLLVFSDCKVTLGDDTLFDPSWGTYDMAVGESISSVFCGAADKDTYDQVSLVPRQRTIKSVLNEKTKQLHACYQKIRDCRQAGNGNDVIPEIWNKVKTNHSSDWLLSMEMLEIIKKDSSHPEVEAEITEFLNNKATENKELTKLINNGLSLLN